MTKGIIFSVKYMRLLTGFLLIGTLALSACLKEKDNNEDGAYIRFINASPTLGTYHVYFDGTKVNNSGALPFGGSVSYALYVYGNHTVKYTTASSTLPVLTKSIYMDRAKIHSLYLVDKDDNMDVLLIQDDASLSSKTQSLVKFINLSPDAPALDLVIKDGAGLVSGKTYKTGSTYALIDSKKYTFEIKDSATGEVKATLNDVDFAASRYYTIIARGLMNPVSANDQSFSGQVIINQ